MTETSQPRPDDVRRSVHQTLVHHFIDWGMVRAHIVKRTGLARQETHIARDQHSFLINLKGGARSGEDFVEGRSIGFTLAALAPAFALSVCCLCFVRREPLPAEDSRDAGDTKGSELHFDGHLFLLAAVYTLLYVCGMMVSVVSPSFVFEELGGAAIDFGQLESAWSVGSILGAILLVPLIRAMDISILQLVILALAAVTFAALKILNLPWALLAFAILGILHNLGRVAVEVRLQSSVPRAALGRAKGALHCSGMFFSLILLGMGAVVSDKVSPSTIFLVFAGILALSIVALVAFRLGWYQKGE